jgi:phenylacetate-CoA ligase
MSFYTRVVSSIVFPLHERLKSHTSVALRRTLERTQWLTPAELRALQLSRLRGFLAEIERRVPYYRSLFQRHGFDPRSVDTLDALRRLPLLDKPAIRAAGDALRATDAGPLSRYNTGGSSGEPLIFYMGKSRKSHDVAAKWRATRRTACACGATG